MSITYSGDNIQDTDGGVLRPISSVMRNRIINGAMVIDQRNAGASVTPSVSSTYQLDRWCVVISQANKFSVQQSTTAPTGFSNSALITSLSAYSVGSGDYFAFTQRIEGFNTSDLGWGTANAKTVTLSFWVRSSLTGTFGGSFRNSAADRGYPFTYTISSANTWEQKSITVAGDTSGTWLTTNGTGIDVDFGLGVGSTYSGTAGAWASANLLTATGATSVVGTSGATFYITGVQLEVGSSATGFEYRNYSTELMNCQRYFSKSYLQSEPIGYASAFNVVRVGVGVYGTDEYSTSIPLKVTMRSTPTISVWNDGGTANSWYALPSLSARTIAGASVLQDFFTVRVNGATSDTALQGCYAASAEL